MKNYYIIFVFLALIAMSFLSSCGSSDDPDPTPEPEPIPTVSSITVTPSDNGLTFIDASIDLDFTTDVANGSTYSWDFGDGNSSTSQNPTHAYEEPNTYNVTFTATNADGVEASTTTTVVVTGVYLKSITVNGVDDTKMYDDDGDPSTPDVEGPWDVETDNSAADISFRFGPITSSDTFSNLVPANELMNATNAGLMANPHVIDIAEADQPLLLNSDWYMDLVDRDGMSDVEFIVSAIFDDGETPFNFESSGSRIFVPDNSGTAFVSLGNTTRTPPGTTSLVMEFVRR